MIELEHAARLWALLALAVPILLHLFSRRSLPPEDFPPAVLMRGDAERAVRRRRLRDLLRLALRLAALAAAALAFARPTLPGRGDAARLDGVALVVAVDDSLSSSRPADPADPKGPTRLERGLAEARAALAALGPGSEAAAVCASGRCAGPDSPGKIAEFLAAGAPAVNADLGRALEAVPGFIEAMAPLEPAALVLSDWEAGAEGGERLAALGRRVRLAAPDLGAPGAGDDWAILGARLDRARLLAGEGAALLVHLLRAPGPGAPAARRLELVLEGVTLTSAEPALAPGEEAEVELAFTAEEGVRLGELRLLGADSWAANDRRPVALSAAAAARVAVLAAPDELETSGRAVRLALSAGPGRERKAFLAETLTPETAAGADLSAYRAFFLVGPPALPAELGRRLAARVADGAGAAILAEEAAGLAALAGPLGLPVPPSVGPAEEFPGGARLVPTRSGEALFEPLGAAVFEPVFIRALRLDASGAGVVARRRGDGGELAGLLERRLGRGPVLLLASGPGRKSGRLAARQSANLFVPLMHELAARAAGQCAALPSARPGEAVETAVSGPERAARFWLHGPGGVRAALGTPGPDLMLRFAAPDAPGAYRLSSEHDGRPLVERAIAVWPAAAELAGRRGEVPREASARAGPGPAPGPAATSLPGRRGGGTELAPYLAAAALALLLAEALAAFLAGPPRQRPDESVPARDKRGRAGA